MSMSRKDFELLAKTIKQKRESKNFDSAVEVIDEVATGIANALHGHSATFDKQRFLKACGVEVKS